MISQSDYFSKIAYSYTIITFDIIALQLIGKILRHTACLIRDFIDDKSVLTLDL